VGFLRLFSACPKPAYFSALVFAHKKRFTGALAHFVPFVRTQLATSLIRNNALCFSGMGSVHCFAFNLIQPSFFPADSFLSFCSFAGLVVVGFSQSINSHSNPNRQPHTFARSSLSLQAVINACRSNNVIIWV